MTDDTQPEALRALAEAAKWTGKWYDAGCNTVYCTYDKEGSILHDEIAHPVPFGVSGYIAAAHPQAVIALLDRIAELEAQLEAVGAGGVQALSAAPAEKQAAPKAAPGEQNTVPAEWLEQAYREGWAACRDAETIGEEAEDWAFGNSTANSRVIDAQQAAPKQEAQEPAHPSCKSDMTVNGGALNVLRRAGKTEVADELEKTAQPAPATQQAGDVVAYLDVGASGYLDLGAALSEDALQQLPKGRHALVIAGTYGIDGYVAAPQPSPAAQGDAIEHELAMLIRRIVSSARRNCEDWSNVLKLANEAWAYLVRKGLNGSPLRDAGIESDPTPPAKAADSVQEDAARYRLLRRGQHWSVIDGIGNDLRAEALDAAVDAAMTDAARATQKEGEKP